MKKLKNFNNRAHKKKIVLSSLDSTLRDSKDIIERIRSKGFEWKGVTYYKKMGDGREVRGKARRIKTERGRRSSLSYYLSGLDGVETVKTKRIKMFRRSQ